MNTVFILFDEEVRAMLQSDRKEFLLKLGYEEPLDESPVEPPDRWSGGSVENTGGNIMCRVWRTWKTGERGRDTEYEVLYNVSQDSSVVIQAYTWDENYEEYVFDSMLDSKKADETNDYAMSEVARQLMKDTLK